PHAVIHSGHQAFPQAKKSQLPVIGTRRAKGHQVAEPLRFMTFIEARNISRSELIEEILMKQLMALRGQGLV
ncbi:hypothetical protein MJL79_29515, partial [Salmonella enterica subsp. enterica serovar Montevideo]|nr:hypothetical protein [Salmonella enterica subsp. enterica serovar Montevideo]